MKRLSLRGALAAMLLAATLPGLGSAWPAFADEGFTFFMSPEDEQRIGDEEHPKILARFGGAYDDGAIGAYVAEIGARLARYSARPDIAYRFTVLNSPVVNAFALPGGYVYVTRGLIALCNNEAELAGVLGHEIAHVTARHAAQRYSQAVTFGLGALALGWLFGDRGIGEIAEVGGELFLQSYSREHEYEADLLAVRTLARAGYAPLAQAAFLASLEQHGALENEIAGRPGAERARDLFATHPRTVDRVERAIAEANEQPVDPVYRRDAFLDRIDGMLYGDDPAQGFVRGQRFNHPSLRVGFEAPADFRLVNTAEAVLAQGPAGAVMRFDQETDRRKVRAARGPVDYLRRVWGARVEIKDAAAITINGLSAATGRARVEGRQGLVDLRPVVIAHDDRFFRFLFVSSPDMTNRLADDFSRAANSFHVLSARELAALRPLKLRIAPVTAADSDERFAAALPFGDRQLARFRALNGLRPNEAIAPGQRVKLVGE